MTKYLIITLTLLFIPTNAVASTGRPADIEFCGVLEKLANTVMTARQNAFSMSDMMGLFPGATDIDNMGRAMVKEAYAEPYWHSQNLKQTAVDNFANKVAKICYSRNDK